MWPGARGGRRRNKTGRELSRKEWTCVLCKWRWRRQQWDARADDDDDDSSRLFFPFCGGLVRKFHTSIILRAIAEHASSCFLSSWFFVSLEMFFFFFRGFRPLALVSSSLSGGLSDGLLICVDGWPRWSEWAYGPS